MDIMYSHGNDSMLLTHIIEVSGADFANFDLLTAVNSKLNAYMISNGIESNEIYSTLISFIKETRGKFLKSSIGSIIWIQKLSFWNGLKPQSMHSLMSGYTMI